MTASKSKPNHRKAALVAHSEPPAPPRLYSAGDANALVRGWDRRPLNVFTYGAFSSGDLLAAILDRTGPADVDIATWTAAGADRDRAKAAMTAGAVRRLRMLVDWSFPARAPEYVATMYRHFGPEAVRVIRNDEWNVVVRTSANLNKNPRLEWFDLADEEPLGAAFAAVFDDIWTVVPVGSGLPTIDELALPSVPNHTYKSPIQATPAGGVAIGAAIQAPRLMG